ncbi:uncharacterized protein PHALS_15480 [Plasmopara halstedii]|uniref:Uncharacterized protein n=1 Tax=Plasmopara halstedii TaxID=4781 RepID=A0A0P1AI65_PLAHL|nr:uncharacterized protein PHALS_15480 [Plasmopara halstedii]CEG40950.1 hypothetical protein PHALS_15480 [Plasmopara halstedii]|eukprot:XP_024577319.1 hypothetical protein PHALS_15480 [Plasmopara halstedii]
MQREKLEQQCLLSHRLRVCRDSGKMMKTKWVSSQVYNLMLKLSFCTRSGRSQKNGNQNYMGYHRCNDIGKTGTNIAHQTFAKQLNWGWFEQSLIFQLSRFVDPTYPIVCPFHTFTKEAKRLSNFKNVDVTIPAGATKLNGATIHVSWEIGWTIG